MTGEIKINNVSTQTTEIDIDGVIGVDEQWQFEQSESNVATYKKFKEALLDIQQIKAKKITVNIRSIGGSVCDALLIYDTLTALGAEVTTKCYGYVASAATIIAQAASENRRLISQNALYLIHKSTTSTQGNSTSIGQAIELLDKTDQRIADIYAFRAGRSSDDFAQLMNENSGNGRWLSPTETLEFGLTDRIITQAEISNETISVAKVMNLPPLPISEKNTTSVTLKQTLRAIRDLLSLAPEPEFEYHICEQSLESINKELEKRAEKIALLETQTAADITTPIDNGIEQLKNRIRQLETQTAKIKAMPTKTLAKEDPAYDGQDLNSTNQAAYQQDLSSLLER